MAGRVAGDLEAKKKRRTGPTIDNGKGKGKEKAVEKAGEEAEEGAMEEATDVGEEEEIVVPPPKEVKGKNAPVCHI